MWSTIDLPGFFTTEGDPAATCPSLSHCGVPGCVGVPAPDGCVGYTCHAGTPSQTFPAHVPLGGGAGGALLVPDGSGVQLPSCTIATKNPGISRIPGSAGGGWGIRTPEGLHPTRFPSVRHRPLGESSEARGSHARWTMLAGPAPKTRTGPARVQRGIPHVGTAAMPPRGGWGIRTTEGLHPKGPAGGCAAHASGW